MINILPQNDIIDHEEDTTCICQPIMEIENGEIMIIHNSLDGREDYEVLDLPLPDGVNEGWIIMRVK